MYSGAFHGVVVAPSDASLKKDIAPAARSALEDIDALKVVDLTWKVGDKPDTGFLAQQTCDVDLAFYYKGANTIGNIAQYLLIIALIISVQELGDKVRTLESRLSHEQSSLFPSKYIRVLCHAGVT